MSIPLWSDPQAAPTRGLGPHRGAPGQDGVGSSGSDGPVAGSGSVPAWPGLAWLTFTAQAAVSLALGLRFFRWE